MTATAEGKPTASVEEAAGALIEQIFGAAIGALELGTIYLGVRLGLYSHLVDTPQSAQTLGTLAAIDQRYAEEWLEQQAIAGFVDVVTEGNRLSRTYRLSPAQAMVLDDPGSPFRRSDQPVGDLDRGHGTPSRRRLPNRGRDFIRRIRRRHEAGTVAVQQVLLPQPTHPAVGSTAWSRRVAVR